MDGRYVFEIVGVLFMMIWGSIEEEVINGRKIREGFLEEVILELSFVGWVGCGVVSYREGVLGRGYCISRREKSEIVISFLVFIVLVVKDISG